MKLDVLNPPELGEAKGYSNGILVPPGARLLFVAGQVGWDREHRFPNARDPADGFTLQFERALASVLEVVRAAGGSPESIARVTVYVADKRLYVQKTREIGRIWRAQMGRWFPAMTLVEVRSLLEENALVELEATAAIPESGERSESRCESSSAAAGGSP